MSHRLVALKTLRAIVIVISVLVVLGLGWIGYTAPGWLGWEPQSCPAGATHEVTFNIPFNPEDYENNGLPGAAGDGGGLPPKGTKTVAGCLPFMTDGKAEWTGIVGLAVGGIIALIAIGTVSIPIGNAPETQKKKKEALEKQQLETRNLQASRKAEEEAREKADRVVAVSAAKLLLKDGRGYSKNGLSDALHRGKTPSRPYGRFSEAVSRWAVNNLDDVDWNEQAVRAAKVHVQRKPSFTRDGLINVLSRSWGFEPGTKFTVAQAEYAADAVGL